MEKYKNLEEFTPKQLRTLRNSLNNRLKNMKDTDGNPKKLSESHRLYGLDELDCEELLKRVKKILKG